MRLFYYLVLYFVITSFLHPNTMSILEYNLLSTMHAFPAITFKSRLSTFLYA